MEAYDSYPAPLRVLVDHMERSGLVHKVEPERNAVTFRIRGRSGGNFRCVGFISEAMDIFQFLVIYPDQVPASRRRAMARAITLANFGMKLGFFELDFDDGELRVHTASAFAPHQLPESVVDWCVTSGIHIADRYYASLQSVSWGDADPADAIFRAENEEASILLDQADEDEEGQDELHLNDGHYECGKDPQEPSDSEDDNHQDRPE